ncbi:MAG: GtrA family protein [Brachymonas sp.]|nr:GtrA family protein [Brachymonas sp.]
MPGGTIVRYFHTLHAQPVSVPKQLFAHPIVRFLVIGSLAAAVHYAVVRALVETGLLRPLTANVIGWLVAFWVSFFGHLRWTFTHQQAPVKQALPRFFLLSAVGFAINEASYALALRFIAWRYDTVLVLVLLAVAVMTFVVSKLWAFRPRKSI